MAVAYTLRTSSYSYPKLYTEPDPNLEEPFCLLETWVGFVAIVLFRPFIEIVLISSYIFEVLMQSIFFRIPYYALWYSILLPGLIVVRTIAGTIIVGISLAVSALSSAWQAILGRVARPVGSWKAPRVPGATPAARHARPRL